MALIDELRMDKTAWFVVTTETPSDAKAYRKTKAIEERLITLEFTKQVFYGYDPSTARLKSILEVLTSP